MATVDRPSSMIADYTSTTTTDVDRMAALHAQYMINIALQDTCRKADVSGSLASTIEYNIRLNESATDPNGVAAATIRPLAENTLRNMDAAVTAGTCATLLATLTARCVAYDPTA